VDWYYLLFLITGIVAGFINTLAGGGSTLTLPVLILAGLPSPVANATNRVAILFQNIMGVWRFHRHEQLQVKPILPITIAAVAGAIAGSLAAVQISIAHFDTLLGIVFIFILIVMLIPKTATRSLGRQTPGWLEIIIFVGIGFYGGLVQAGVGFLFLAGLNLIEHYNLIRANAIKLFIILCYTLVAVFIFGFFGKIMWLYGLALAIGNMAGAYLGVISAIKKGEKLVRVVLTIAIVVACLKLFGVFNLLGLTV